MKLSEINIHSQVEYKRLSAKIHQKDKPEPFEIYYEYPNEYDSFLTDRADPFVPTLLQPSMLSGEDLFIEAPVSNSLFQRLPEIQEILCQFYPELHSIDVQCNNIVPDAEAIGESVGAFFSLGVDSFYTLLKNIHKRPDKMPKITHLIFMEGLENTLNEFSTNSKDVASEVAENFQLPIICGRSNLRDHFPIDWTEYCGAGLASTALSLSNQMGHVFIPSSFPYSKLVPWGSHPILDILWRTNALTIIHDGCESSRAEKTISLIANNPIALKYLRVCLNNKGDSYNCGHCVKCIRTMIALKIVDALGKCTTLPDRLPKHWKKTISYGSERTRHHIEDNYSTAVKYSKDPLFIEQLKKAGRRAEIKSCILKILNLNKGDLNKVWLFRRIFG